MFGLAYKGNPIMAAEYVKRNGIKFITVHGDKYDGYSVWEMCTEKNKPHGAGFKHGNWRRRYEAVAKAKELAAVLSLPYVGKKIDG